jgi:hypothetical protein
VHVRDTGVGSSSNPTIIAVCNERRITIVGIAELVGSPSVVPCEATGGA